MLEPWTVNSYTFGSPPPALHTDNQKTRQAEIDL